MSAVCCDRPVLEQKQVAPDIMRLTVQWTDMTHMPHPGQFFMLRSWGSNENPTLGRPISVHDYNPAKKSLTFLYQVKGEGTRKLAALQEGDSLRLVGPCGNGFDVMQLVTYVHKAEKNVAIVSGGIGVAPLRLLCKILAGYGIRPDFYAGFRDCSYALSTIQKCCNKVEISTDSGTEGYHGLIADLLNPTEYGMVITCGPVVMMQAVAKKCKEAGVPCVVSMESKMACGLGACLGCTCHTKLGAKTVCKDGPVFNAEEVFDLD